MRGIAILGPMKSAASSGEAERLYYERDAHWTRTGHRLAAEALAAKIREGGWPQATSGAPD